MELAEHIARICKIEDINVERSSRNGRAWRNMRAIEIPPVKSEITYALALHEIGHILGKRQSGTRLDKEVGAWEWAIEHALCWTPKMADKMRRCLQTYMDWSQRSSQARKPKADHPIHAMLAQPSAQRPYP